MSEYIWKIERLECAVNTQYGQNYVIAVDWSCKTTINGVTDGIRGGVVFNVEQQQNYIPFDQLTEQIVLDWVFNSEGFDKAAMENQVLNHMDVILNPKIITPPLPWQS